MTRPTALVLVLGAAWPVPCAAVLFVVAAAVCLVVGAVRDARAAGRAPELGQRRPTVHDRHPRGLRAPQPEEVSDAP